MMTKLGQACLFSNLITILVQWCRFSVGIVGTTELFFYYFQGRNLLRDDRNFKRGREVKKGENQTSMKSLSYPFYQTKLLSWFASISQDSTH